MDTVENNTQGGGGDIKSAAELFGNHKENLLDIPDATMLFDRTAPEQPEKRGRGRPKKKQAAPEVETTYIEAETLVHINDGLISMLAGNIPPHDELRAAYVAELARYMKESGKELPAWVKIAAIAGAYNMRALQSPTFRERIYGAWIWLKSKFVRG